MRLATFNVQHGTAQHSAAQHGPDAADGSVDLARFAAAVAALDADVLALQEVDRDQPRSHRADLTAVAAEALGAAEHRFAATLVGSPGAWRAARTLGSHRAPGTPAYGIALVSRFPVLTWREVRLPGRAPVRRRGGPGWRFDEPRAALVAVLDAPGGPLTVVATHLSVVRTRNHRQLRRLVRHAESMPSPGIVLGDLNMSRADAVRHSGWESVADVPTYPVGTPRHQIDHVLTRGDVRVHGPARALDTGISDHRALVVDLDLDTVR